MNLDLPLVLYSKESIETIMPIDKLITITIRSDNGVNMPRVL